MISTPMTSQSHEKEKSLSMKSENITSDEIRMIDEKLDHMKMSGVFGVTDRD